MLRWQKFEVLAEKYVIYRMEIDPHLVTWTAQILAERRREILKKILQENPEKKEQIRKIEKKYEYDPQPLIYI